MNTGYDIYFDAAAFGFQSLGVPLENLAGLDTRRVVRMRDAAIGYDLTREEMEMLVQYAGDLAHYEEQTGDQLRDNCCVDCACGGHGLPDRSRRCECPCHDPEEERWSCPYCGEITGYPRETTSREYQGESPHGGMVETRVEGCSLCIREGM